MSFNGFEGFFFLGGFRGIYVILEVFEGIFWPFCGFKNILVIFYKLLSLFLMFLLLLLFGYFEDLRGMFVIL